MTRLTRIIKNNDRKTALKIIANKDLLAKIDFAFIYCLHLILFVLANLKIISNSYVSNNLLNTSYLNLKDRITNYTPLELACLTEQIKVTDALLTKGMRFQDNHQVYHNIAILAVKKDKIDFFERLQQAGDKYIFDGVGNGLTLLQKIIISNDFNNKVKILEKLFAKLSMQEKTTIINSYNNCVRKLPCAAAIRDLNSHFANFIFAQQTGFINHAPDVQNVEPHMSLTHVTALFCATMCMAHKDVALIEYLLENGANPNAITAMNGKCYTPLSAALQLKKEQMAIIMLKHGASLTLENDAISKAYDEVFDLLDLPGNQHIDRYYRLLDQRADQPIFAIGLIRYAENLIKMHKLDIPASEEDISKQPSSGRVRPKLINTTQNNPQSLAGKALAFSKQLSPFRKKIINADKSEQANIANKMKFFGIST
jgi:ankyrin repeat protein